MSELKPQESLKTRLARVRDDILNPLVEDAPADVGGLRDVLKRLHIAGVAGLRFPTEYGGLGEGLRAQAEFAEMLGSMPSGGLGMSLTIHYDMVAPLIAEFGDHAQRERFLRPMIEGRIVISHAISEAGAGADVGSVATLATATDGGWRIDGGKRWISLGMQADYHIVLARVAGRRAPFDTGLFLIPADTEGVSARPVEGLLGNDGCPIADLSFDGVRIDDSLRVGGAGFGLVNQMKQFAQERIISSLRANANARWGLDRIIAYARKRKVSGEALIDNAHWRLQLAGLDASWRQSRALAWKAFAVWESGQDIVAISSAAKMTSSRLVRRVTETGVQISGVDGYRRDHPLNRLRRDARLYSISTGSDEMMLLSIARAEKWAS